MAKLSASARKKLPSSSFGVPSKAKTPAGKAKSGSFPIPDKNHARAALREIGNASPAERPGIRAKANAKLGRSSSKGKSRGK